MTKYLTPDQVCELIPGMTKGQLSHLRATGKGPRYRRPTPKKIYYVESEVIEWIEASARQATTQGGGLSDAISACGFAEVLDAATK